MSEKQIQNEIRLALGALDDVVLWRNNTGVDTNRGVRYGLCKGSSDLVGICAGRFFALEVKTPKGRVSVEQQMFIDLVKSYGGHGAIVRSVEDALDAVEEARKC